jgi:hypothetical protein
MATVHKIRVGSCAPIISGWRPFDSRLEKRGARLYNLSGVRTWLHPGQKNGAAVKGTEIFDCLRRPADTFGNRMLDSCLNSQDALEIEKKGIVIFRMHFGVETLLYFWGSVSYDISQNLYVPYLFIDGNKLSINWRQVNGLWHKDDVAVLFPTRIIWLDRRPISSVGASIIPFKKAA